MGFCIAAQTVSALIHTLESVGDSLQLLFLPPTQLEGHLLVLHSIHARETADGGVQLHHASSVLTCGKIGPNFLFQRVQLRAKLIEAPNIH